MELVYDIESYDNDDEKYFKKPIMIGKCSYVNCGISIFLDQHDGKYRHFNDGGGVAIKKDENYFCSSEHFLQYLDDKYRNKKYDNSQIKLKENTNFHNLFKLNMGGKKKKIVKKKSKKRRKKRLSKTKKKNRNRNKKLIKKK